MVRMIPQVPRMGANSSERRLFNAFEGLPNKPDWIVLHSLAIRRHVDKLTGEADFVVVVPGKGVVVVEAKAPSSIDYTEGVWHLEGVPDPGKSPLEQVDGAVRSIRSFLMRTGVIEGKEPFARLLWFTSVGRHRFGGRVPSDLTFFEWELAWADDLTRSATIIEKVLDEHIGWHARSKKVHLDPAAMTPAKADAITGALLQDFNVIADERDARRYVNQNEAAMLTEQRFALELVDANPSVYFDGPAGSGKSYLVAQAAINAVKRRERTLLTCWNVVMADRLSEMASKLKGPLWVADLGAVMLRVAGVEVHPADAAGKWYQETLPRLALAALKEHPERGGYRQVLVDEFQDIAGNPLLVDVLLALAAPDAHVMLAGDERQQIMRPLAERVDPFVVAKARRPDLVLVRIRRNCRQAPVLVANSERLVGRPFGFTSHRLPQSTSGSAEQVTASPGQEPAMLAGVLKALAPQYGLDRIVVLSPWGSQSTAARVVSGVLDDAAQAADLRWLRANLGEGDGRAAYGSVSKLKGIEADAIVITDVGQDAQTWAGEHDLDWDDLLYVALSRAKYRAIVMETVAP